MGSLIGSFIYMVYVFIYAGDLICFTKKMSNRQGDDAEYMEDVDDEMEDVEDDMDEEFRGDDLGASDSDVEEFDYSVSMLDHGLFILLGILLYNLVFSFFFSFFTNRIFYLCVCMVSEQ